MRWQTFISSFMCVACFTVAAWAQSGESVLPDDLFAQVVATNSGERTIHRYLRWQAQPVPVNGPTFTQGLRVTVNGTSARLSDAGLGWLTTRAVRANDNLTLTFWVRKLAPHDNHNLRARVIFGGVHEAEAEMSLATPIPCDDVTWMRYTIPFQARRDYVTGAARLTFHFGQGPQVFELGGFALTNAGQTPPLSATGTRLILEDPTRGYGVYFDSSVGGGAARVIDVTNQPFTKAIELTVNGQSTFIYNAGLQYRNTVAFKRDDVMLLSFWARKLEPASGTLRAQVVFERRTDFAKALFTTFSATNDAWQFYQLPLRANADADADAYQLAFQFALGPQKFLLADIKLVNFGTEATLAQLPTTYPYTYRGERNAAWRQAAHARINEIRKATLTVNVQDAQGRPLSDASVYIQQLEHTYKFGSAVVANRIITASPDHDQYRARVTSHFTTTVLENDLKWPLWECTGCTTFTKDGTVRALQWLRERGLAIRGHNLIWPSWSNSPNDIRNLGADALRKRIDDHFAEILNYPGVNGQLYQWDVINEAFTNNDVMGLIGGVAGVTQRNGVLPNQEMVRWFQMARQHDPTAKLYYNDYDILAASGWNRQKQDYVFTLVNWLLDHGAPVDGLGLQGHFGAVTQIETMQQIIERFAQLRVPFNITEFDFNTADEALQADFTRDFVTLMFSTPRCTDFLMWGFWERAHWLPLGAMYRADWSSKPNALVWNDLWFHEWWTNESGVTASEGQFKTRAFKGTHHVMACAKGQCQQAVVKLEGDGDITLKLSTALRGAGRGI
jgi:GH35 family endo-1,4-beta-xylanase